jgi:hypothetical protein
VATWAPAGDSGTAEIDLDSLISDDDALDARTSKVRHGDGDAQREPPAGSPSYGGASYPYYVYPLPAPRMSQSPSDLAHPVARPCSDRFARCVASPPPVPESLQEGVPATPCRRRSDRRHHVSRSRPYRLTQNLSLVTVPLSTPTASASKRSIGPRRASATPTRRTAGPGWCCWPTSSSAWPAAPSRIGASPGSDPSVPIAAPSPLPACATAPGRPRHTRLPAETLRTVAGWPARPPVRASTTPPGHPAGRQEAA